MVLISPIESVINGTNGDVIFAAAQLWIKEDDKILDCTYGRGMFWSTYQPKDLVKGDIDPAKGDGFDFRDRPEPDWSYDVVVFDPPYIAQGGRDTSTIPDMQERYGLYGAPTTPNGVDTLIQYGMREAERLLVPGGVLFVKCMDYISSAKYHSGHRTVVNYADILGMAQVDEFVHHSGTGPQPKTNLDGTPRRQVHSRRAHSFLCIFQKRKR